MNERTLADLFTRERRSDRPALVDATAREYDAHWLITSSWKAGNFLRHSGVRRGVRVGIVGDGPLAVLAFFGTTLLEGTSQFAPPITLAGEDDVRAIVGPVDELDEYDLPAGAQRIGYGRKPADPAVHHFDAGLWSENPSFPPLEIDPDTNVIAGPNGSYSHGEVLETAREVISEYGIESGTSVGVDAPLSDPRTVVAGLIAPLVSEGVIVLGSDADLVVADGASEEAATEPIHLETVPLPLSQE